MPDAATAICRLLAPPPDPRTDGELLTAFRRTRDELWDILRTFE